MASSSGGKPWETGNAVRLTKQEAFNPSSTEAEKHAAHAMFYSTSNKMLFGKIPMHHSILMTLRFDGTFGFPGGFIDKKADGELEVIEDGLNRELAEEMNLDPKHFLSREDHLTSFFSEKPFKLVTHFYTKEVSQVEFEEIERRCLGAIEWGKETLGITRVPVQKLQHRKPPLVNFLRNRFIGNARQELVEGMIDRRIISETDLLKLWPEVEPYKMKKHK